MNRNHAYLLVLLLLVPASAHAGRGGRGFCDRKPHRCDQDGDGLTDARELDLGTDRRAADTDGDGVDDGDDCFPLDGGEWADSDGDGVGDNADPDDDDNGVDDADELTGGDLLADAGLLPGLLDVVLCPWDLDGPVDLQNPACGAYVLELRADGSIWQGPNAGEWVEDVNSNDAVTLTFAFPGLETASMRGNGAQVPPVGGAPACYEGNVDALGGGYDAGTGESWSYWFATGRFAGCLR